VAKTIVLPRCAEVLAARGITAKELGKRAGLDYVTARRAVNGLPIRVSSALKIHNALQEAGERPFLEYLAGMDANDQAL